ncbi:response regulator transcription factor [Actinomadura rugatobispora]|uniref:Response regulator transcription factor n=1 Tax=Actinomadura rugatobispora TaxID=1994 RepID=A0ABW0ZTH1_9ACTN|nr:hypothetical protein GCM10010200_080980 [Actinomadura rugatobispora]
MSGARLLVIEDDPEIGSELVTALNEQGYTVGLAGTGGAAVAMVDRRPPELIFLDLGLPDVDGVELCSVLRRRLPDTAIVVLTARSRERDVVSALDVGAWGSCWRAPARSCAGTRTGPRSRRWSWARSGWSRRPAGRSRARGRSRCGRASSIC